MIMITQSMKEVNQRGVGKKGKWIQRHGKECQSQTSGGHL